MMSCRGTWGGTGAAPARGRYPPGGPHADLQSGRHVEEPTAAGATGLESIRARRRDAHPVARARSAPRRRGRGDRHRARGRGGASLRGGGAHHRGPVRTLVAHEASGYEEWGVSGSVRLDPGASGRGLSLKLAPVFGAPSSGVEHLWSARDAGGLVGTEDFEGQGWLVCIVALLLRSGRRAGAGGLGALFGVDAPRALRTQHATRGARGVRSTPRARVSVRQGVPLPSARSRRPACRHRVRAAFVPSMTNYTERSVGILCSSRSVSGARAIAAFYGVPRRSPKRALAPSNRRPARSARTARERTSRLRTPPRCRDWKADERQTRAFACATTSPIGARRRDPSSSRQARPSSARRGGWTPRP